MSPERRVTRRPPEAEEVDGAVPRIRAMRAALSAALPDRLLFRARRLRAHAAARRARAAFAAADREPAFLPREMLDRLNERFPYPMDYRYDAATLARRGASRFRDLQRLTPSAPRRGSTLELGCGDGMLSRELKRDGARAVALDLSPHMFDERARAEGVSFVVGDAAALPLAADEFDLVVSFNSFEHFHDPHAVLREVIRVTRPGGFVYLNFGPLYGSAFGLHAGRSVNVPFCQYLFERQVLEAFTAERDGYPIPFETLNGWRVQQYRDLFAQARGSLRPVLYREVPYVDGLDLVVAHSSAFRSKTDDFDDVLIGEIEVLFERLDGASSPA